VVAGGSIGSALPGAAAVVAAAWLGAGLVSEDYRFGLGLSTYTRLPRRGAGLFGKLVVAAWAAFALAVVTRVCAFMTALGGFALAHTTSATGSVSPSYLLLLPSVAELFFATLGGVVGVLSAPLLRLRPLAVVAACGFGAFIAAFVPHSHSPYVLPIVRALMWAGLPIGPTVVALPEFALFALGCGAFVAVHRREIA
jgi:hypothetical protein